MKMLTINEFAAERDIHIRTVQKLCAAGRIEGARKEVSGQYLAWRIPKDAKILPTRITKSQLARDMMAQNPGMSGRDIALAIGAKPSLISHVKRRAR